MNDGLLPTFHKTQELTRDSFEKQLSFHQHILLVSSSVLSIVISLHSYNESPLYIRVIFISAVILLTLGVLTCAIALYSQKEITERGRQAYISAHIEALRTGKNPGVVSIKKTSLHKTCETLTCILLPLSIVLLAIYTILENFS